jgi:hypothetical protein
MFGVRAEATPPSSSIPSHVSRIIGLREADGRTGAGVMLVDWGSVPFKGSA